MGDAGGVFAGDDVVWDVVESCDVSGDLASGEFEGFAVAALLFGGGFHGGDFTVVVLVGSGLCGFGWLWSYAGGMSGVARAYGSEVLRLDVDRDLWDQHEGEPDEYYGVFRAFLRLARPRKLTKLIASGEVTWSAGHLRRVAELMQWDSRAVAWDQDRDDALDGRIADARIEVLHRRLDFLEEMTGLTLTAMKEKDPGDLKPRDLIELLKILLIAEDNLLGLPQRATGNYAGTQVGVEVNLPVGQTSTVIEGQIKDLMAEIQSREAADPSSD